MSWFARQAQTSTPEKVTRDQGRYLRAAGVDRALDQWAGPYGVRRFVFRFARQGMRIRTEPCESVSLRQGGGPPLPDPTGDYRGRLERALLALYNNMATGPVWDRGAIAYLRDAAGAVQIIPTFDEDSDKADLDALPVPDGPGHPLEDPALSRLLLEWEGRMLDVRARTNAIPHDWAEWEVKDDHELRLIQATGAVRSARCQTLATFEPARQRFTWQCGAPLFDEALYTLPNFPCTWEGAYEVGLLTATRLGAQWLFTQAYDERGSVLMVAVLR